MRGSTKLRKIFESRKDQVMVVVGAHNAFYAKIAEAVGFDAAHVSGACTSLERLGLADLGLITATEMIENVRYITAATKLPVIADADTGYGNAINVMRTVKEFIRAGAAAIHIEDQLEPKRCSHLRGKLLISKEEMIGKIKAAKKVIKEEDEDFVLIARTDARNAVGGGLKEVIERLNAYAEAGADIVFSDVLLSKDEIKKVKKEAKAPLAYHTNGLSPKLFIEECKELGIIAIVYPITPFHIAATAIRDFYQELKKKGTQAQMEFEEKVKNHPVGTLIDLFKIGGLTELLKYEMEYLPERKTIIRYEKSFGLMPEEK